MSAVEQILQASTTQPALSNMLSDGRPAATHALWICACVTEHDAPRWLIYASHEPGISWQRVPSTGEVWDLVAAEHRASGHADPVEVLRWLEGKAADPWAAGGDAWGDAAVIETLRMKILGR